MIRIRSKKIQKAKAILLYSRAKKEEEAAKKVEVDSARKKAAKKWYDRLSEHKGDKGGQCKAFVWNAFNDYTDLQLPRNDTVKEFCWKTTRPWLEMFYTLDNAMIGDMIQIAYKRGLPATLHTLVFKEKVKGGIMAVDSNWNGDEIVQEHFISQDWWDKWVKRFTIYRYDFTKK